MTIATPHVSAPQDIKAPRAIRPPLPEGRTLLVDVYAPFISDDEPLFMGPIWQCFDSATEVTVYACAFCSQQASCVHDLYKHFVRSHLQTTFWYKCPVCAAATECKTAFYRHTMECGRSSGRGQGRQCELCGKVCVNALEVYTHQWRKHIGGHVYRIAK